jgi:hypothetical protein
MEVPSNEIASTALVAATQPAKKEKVRGSNIGSICIALTTRPSGESIPRCWIRTNEIEINTAYRRSQSSMALTKNSPPEKSALVIRKFLFFQEQIQCGTSQRAIFTRGSDGSSNAPFSTLSRTQREFTIGSVEVEESNCRSSSSGCASEVMT